MKDKNEAKSPCLVPALPEYFSALLYVFSAPARILMMRRVPSWMLYFLAHVYTGPKDRRLDCPAKDPQIINHLVKVDG